MLVRRIARPLLASSFVYGGVQTLRNPQSRVPGAAPIVEQLTEIADKQLPVQVSHDVEQWVKINAGVHVGAGTLLALGKFPRFSALALATSLVPTTFAGHRFWEHEDPESKAQHRTHFFKNLGLLGGVLLAAVDTEGQPGVAWRVRHATHHTATGSRRAARTARREAKLAAHAAKAKLPV